MKALDDNLMSKNLVVKKTQLSKLNPILHDGILRVGGRLEKSTMSFNAKHPMILPQHHHVTDLIIQHYHRQDGHMGPTQVLATIRQMFWIIHGPAEVRRVIKNCVDCQKQKRETWDASYGSATNRTYNADESTIYIRRG